MFGHRPAVIFCIPFIAGIIIGWQIELPILIPFIASLLSLFLAIWYFRRKHISYIPLIIVILTVNFGILKIGYDAKLIPSDNIVHFISPKPDVILIGRLTDLPRISSRSIQFVVSAEKLIRMGREFSVSGGVAVTVRNSGFPVSFIDSLSYGRKLLLCGSVTGPGMVRNPGEFDIGRYYHLNNIDAKFIVRRMDTTSFTDPPPVGNFQGTFVFPVRKAFAARIDRFIGGEEGNFLKGLLLGERSDIPPDVKTAFINAGVMHIIAVSGLHVAIVTMILMVFFQFLRIPEKLRIVITSIILVYYNYLTGGAASVTRSVIMGIIFLSGGLFERRSDMYNTLAISAVIILLADAKQLFQPGFQLSFVAVFSLVYLYPKVYGLTKFLPEAVRLNPVIKWTAAALSVSVAAGIGTLPFTSYYFGKISIISFVANMVDVPLSNLILAVGMLAIGMTYISSWLGSVYADATSFLTFLLLRSVSIFGNSPLAYIESHFTVVSSLAFYGAVGIILNLGRKPVRRVVVHCCAAGLCFWIYYPWFAAGDPAPLRVTVLDVGQGDALFIETPGGRTILIDAGPRTITLDAGARFVLPFLQRKSIRQIDQVIISHPHSDHIGGIPAILRGCCVREVIEAGSGGGSDLGTEYRRLLDSLNIPRRRVKSGDIIAFPDNCRLYVLHPSGSFCPDSLIRRNLNNESLVLKLHYGRTSILLAGDAESEAENQMCRIYGDFLKSDILKVAHHGSITGTTERFVSMLRPVFAAISVGAFNKLKHPSPLVISRLSSVGCCCLRTDELGAVVLESDGNRWQNVDWR